MALLAAPGDTWGIPGPTFLRLYLLAVFAVGVGSLMYRRRVLAGTPVSQVDQLDPQQVAFLNGGDQLAVWTSLGGLRGAGVIGVSPYRWLTATGPLPAGATPLDQAIHRAATRGLPARELIRDEWVGRALRELRDGLRRQGLALTPEQRRAARRGSSLLFMLLALGVIRLVAGLSNDRPVGYLLLSLIPVGIAAALLRRVPWRTRAADAALRDLRQRHTHLAPSSTPAYQTYGAAGAAMGVALFGTASLWVLDPGFAEQAQIQRQALSGTGTSTGGGGGSATGSGCGGGSSCSGGSSCGGGGCGGGGCGG